MNPALVNAIFLHIVIPEIARRLAARGALPQTKEELIAEMNDIATTFLNAGEEFLRRHNAL